MRRALPLLLSLWLAGCQTPPDPRWQTLNRTEFPQADAVVLLDEARLTFERDLDGGLRMQRRVRVKVLTPGGRAYANVAIPMDAWTTLKDFEAWSSDALGESRVTADQDTVFTVPAQPDAGVLYSDVRVGQTVVPGVDVGDVFEYRYTVHIKQIFALPTWTFEGQLPVETSRLMVRETPGLRWAFADDGEARAFEPTRRDGWLVWERHTRPAFERIDFGPPIGDQLARMRLIHEASPAGGTWGTVAGWYHGLMQSRLALPLAERKAVQALAKGMSAADRARLVFERVRDSVRYVATHEGIGAFQPHAVADVLRSGYGDCKDMVTTALAYAGALDLKAYPVLIGTAGHGVFDKDLPSVSSFNHVILAINVDGKLRFADPTAKDTAWGELPWHVQGRTGLLVMSGRTKLLTLKARPANTNQLQARWVIGADSGLTLTARMSGLNAQAWRGLSPQAQERAVRRRFLGGMPGAQLGAVTLAEADGVIEVTAQATWPQLWRPFGAGQQGLALHPFLARYSEVRVPVDHETPVHLGPPHTWHVEVVLPWGDAALPAASSAKTAIGESVWTARQADGRATLTHVYTMNHAQVPAKALSALRTLTEHGTRISRLVLMRPDARPDAPTEAAQ